MCSSESCGRQCILHAANWHVPTCKIPLIIRLFCICVSFSPCLYLVHSFVRWSFYECREPCVSSHLSDTRRTFQTCEIRSQQSNTNIPAILCVCVCLFFSSFHNANYQQVNEKSVHFFPRKPPVKPIDFRCARPIAFLKHARKPADLKNKQQTNKDLSLTKAPLGHTMSDFNLYIPFFFPLAFRFCLFLFEWTNEPSTISWFFFCSFLWLMR